MPVQLCQSSSESMPSICLCSMQKKTLKIMIKAEIEDGCLQIKGQESAAGNEDVLYDNVYEFCYRFNADNTGRLWNLLAQKQAAPLLDLLAQDFGGLYGCEKLRDLCRGNKIGYSFTSFASYD